MIGVKEKSFKTIIMIKKKIDVIVVILNENILSIKLVN